MSSNPYNPKRYLSKGNAMRDLLKDNRERDLYFVMERSNRIIFIPQGWCDSFTYANGFCGGPDWNENDPRCDDADEPELYAYVGNAHVNDWLKRESREWYTYDVNHWIPIERLLTMREVTQQEARQMDPDLFRLLDAIGSGEAK